MTKNSPFFLILAATPTLCHLKSSKPQSAGLSVSLTTTCDMDSNTSTVFSLTQIRPPSQLSQEPEIFTIYMIRAYFPRKLHSPGTTWKVWHKVKENKVTLNIFCVFKQTNLTYFLQGVNTFSTNFCKFFIFIFFNQTVLQLFLVVKKSIMWLSITE